MEMRSGVNWWLLAASVAVYAAGFFFMPDVPETDFYISIFGVYTMGPVAAVGVALAGPLIMRREADVRWCALALVAVFCVLLTIGGPHTDRVKGFFLIAVILFACSCRGKT